MFVVHHHQRTMIVPNNTSSQTTASDWNVDGKKEYSGMGTASWLLALSIKTSLLPLADHTGCCCFSFLSLSRRSFREKKKEAADRAVSLNVIWIEWQTRKEKQFCPKKEFRVSDRFTDGYLWADKCYMLKHSEWVLLIHTTCLYVRLCMHQTFLPFIMALATCERRSDMKCIIK